MKYTDSPASQGKPQQFILPEEEVSRALVLVVWVASAFAAIIGGLIVGVGEDRLATSPAWKFILWLPGDASIAGFILLLCGLIGLAGMKSRSPVLVGNTDIITGAFCVITGCFLAAGSAFSQTGGVLGGPMFLFVGFIYTVLGALVRRSE